MQESRETQLMVKVPVETARRFKALCAEEGITISAVLRLAIEEFIQAREKK